MITTVGELRKLLIGVSNDCELVFCASSGDQYPLQFIKADGWGHTSEQKEYSGAVHIFISGVARDGSQIEMIALDDIPDLITACNNS